MHAKNTHTIYAVNERKSYLRNNVT